MKPNLNRILTMVTLAAVASASGCNLFKTKEDSGMSLRQTDSAVQGSIGIKDLNQLGPAYSAALGVPIDAALGDEIANASPWLSTDGTVENVNATMLLAITGLAGNFCKAFILKEAGLAADQRKAHKSVDFTKGSSGLTPVVAAEVLERYAQILFRRSLDADEKKTLSDSLTEAILSVPISSTSTPAEKSASAQNALLVPCTAAASSLEFIKE